MAFEGTAVEVNTSRDQIEKILIKHSADKVTFGQDDGIEILGFRLAGMAIKIAMPVIDRAGSRSRTPSAVRYQQARRETWRAIHWYVKTQFDVLAIGGFTVAQAFLPWVVNPASGQTVWEESEPFFAEGYMQLGNAGMKIGVPLLAAGR